MGIYPAIELRIEVRITLVTECNSVNCFAFAILIGAPGPCCVSSEVMSYMPCIRVPQQTTSEGERHAGRLFFIGDFRLKLFMVRFGVWFGASDVVFVYTWLYLATYAAKYMLNAISIGCGTVVYLQ